MSSVSFVSGNRSIGLNQFHLEWCPKYREAILYGGVLKVVEASVIRTAAEYGIILHNLHVSADHLHIFASLPFDTSVSEAFRLFKGRSAREVFQAYPELRATFRKGHFWSPGKFCRSISNVKAATIQKYIKNHALKELDHSIVQAREEAEQMRLCTYFQES